MAVKLLIMENKTNIDERHADLLASLRKYLKNDEITIEYSEKGKPYICGMRKHISVTTTGKYMICAVADTPIGIDGEYLPRLAANSGKTDYSAIAERFFDDNEAVYIHDGDDDAERFAKVWVRKEAYVKFTGKGLADFASFSVSDGVKLLSKVNNIPVKKLTVNIEDASDYVFAIVGDYGN